MPFDRQRPGDTREMRMVSMVINLNAAVPDQSLPEFIARRRTPGETWRTWREISFELAEVIGEIVNDRTLNLWAKRYGIPEKTTATMEGKDVKAYSAALKKAHIVVT